VTAIGGRPKPELCFFPGRLRWTLLPKERYGNSLTNKLGYWFCLFNNRSSFICCGIGFLSLAGTTLICKFRLTEVNARESIANQPLSWLLSKKENSLHVTLTLLTKLLNSSYELSIDLSVWASQNRKFMLVPKRYINTLLLRLPSFSLRPTINLYPSLLNRIIR